MKLRKAILGFTTTVWGAIAPPSLGAQNVAAQGPPYGRPDATIDLRTKEGTQLVKGAWRYSDVQIIETDFRAPGPDLKPSGKPTKTYDYTPHAGAADFDDSHWVLLDSETLEARRSTGKVCFNWYRINVTIPDKVGKLDTRGSTVAFEIVIDDYAEVWVDGKLPSVYGQSGGSVIKGYNAPNRVIIARDALPGRKIQLAIFGINGPISVSPNNFIWVKSAVLDFYKAGHGNGIGPVETKVIRKDPTLDNLFTPGAKIEKLAGGFLFTEGPVWDREGGYLLFSDPNNNLIYRWTPDGEVSVYRSHSGYTGTNIGEYGQPGSNGLTLDKQGRLTINEHGNRRVTRLEKNGVLTVLADRYEGKRLNSPNDLVYRSDGVLYFTDPPFGLPKFFDDPRKELPYSGVFCLINGQLKLVSTDLSGPNGLAFSPNEKYLYVDNWDLKKEVIMRYEVQPDGTLANGKVFFDSTGEPGEDAWDGMKVDQQGNLYLSGPGGLWIISPEGKHLGTIAGPEHPHNMAWGDEDGKTLYMCAQTGLYRIRFNVPGVRP
ncbi:MAG TPA: SMP-30/gluconolactonase/LRE family protein [Candidatus Sulfotelmatobacter sp.]|nr:SMP-30/gluconolactonase/LRE family protein [Candidatus Sulfotelmatobacter sp.]